MIAAMAFDSLIASAALFGCTIASWWLSAALAAQARLYVRFAAVLLASLAAASTLGLSGIAVLLLLPMAAAALALAGVARFARPLGSLSATLLLVASLAAGLYAMLFDFWIAGLVPAAVAGLVIIAAALNAMSAAGFLSGLALFAAALACLEKGAEAGMLLFAAAALLGLARNPLARNQLVRSTRSERRGAAVP